MAPRTRRTTKRRVNRPTLCAVCGTPKVFSQKLGFPVCPNYRFHNDRKALHPSETAEPKNNKPRPNYLDFIPSDQQQTIIDTLLQLVTDREEGNMEFIALEGIARAGTGKTTTAGMCLAHVLVQYPSLKVAYAAFNRSAANEASEKMPEPVTVNTLHSLLGRQAITTTFPDSVINAAKPFQMAQELVPRHQDYREERKLDVMRYTLVQVYGLVMNQLVDYNNRDAVATVCDFYGIEFRQFGIEYFTDLVRDMVEMSLATLDKHMSFEDMVGAPIMHKKVAKNIPRFDVLVADEAQDLTFAQQVLVLISVGFTPAEIVERFGIEARSEFGVLVYIGDERQAIYAFRGALREGLDNFYDLARSSSANIYSCYLTKTRRCPRRVVELANRFVPDLEALDEAPEGKVYFTTYSQVLEFIGTGRSDVLFVSRTNAPLALAAIRLIKEGVPVEFVSKDMTGQVGKVARGFIWGFEKEKGRQPTTEEFVAEMLSRMNRIVESAKGKKLKAKDALKLDQYELLASIAGVCEDWHDFFSSIANLFSPRGERKANAVRFATIHAAKGGEAPYVILVGGSNMPHPLAELEWELEQEWNMLYVAITRALNEFWFMDEIPASLADHPVIELMA